MASYAALPAEIAQRNAAELRVRRLNKQPNNWIGGMFFDLLMGAGPWVIGVAAVAAGLVAIYENVDGATDTFALFNAPVAIAAIASFSAFLLVGKQSTNLGNNAKIIIASGKSVDFLTLQDGKGSTFQTTRVGLVCASIPYVVKYTGRGTEIRPEGLPLGQDPRLLRGYVTLVTAGTGGPGMSPFAACILLVGELIDEFQTGEKPSEYSVLFGQLNAVTAAEGSIGGTAGYSTPYLMKYLLYTLQIMYLVLFLMTDLVPKNRWNSLWIGAVFVFCTTGFWAISERYGNPMRLRSKMMGQKTFVASACIDTEVAITSIFARAKSPLITGGGEAPTGLKLTLGFGQP